MASRKKHLLLIRFHADVLLSTSSSRECFSPYLDTYKRKSHNYSTLVLNLASLQFEHTHLDSFFR